MRRCAWLFCCMACCFGVVDLFAQANEGETSAVGIKRMYESYKRSFPDVPDVSRADLLAKDDGLAVVFVDVRRAKEQAVSMIPGAITQKQFEAASTRYLGRKVVAYCTIGYRSGLYAKRLRAQGWDAFNLEAGILGWVHAGGDVEHDGSTTKRVHVYGKKWDLLPDGYESVR